MPYKDKDRARQWSREHMRKNKEHHREYQRKWHRQNTERIRTYLRKNLYGITADEYNQLLTEQRGRCAVCFESLPLTVDHDHDTEVVRGLLCRTCNIGLGHFKDSILRLQSAIDYLSRY